MNADQLCMGCMGDKGQGAFCPHCGWKEGTQPESPTYLKPRTMLAGQYLIGRVLGHGGFGITYLAYDIRLNIKLAIKEYLPGDLATRSSDGTNVSIYTGEKTNHFQYGLEKFEEEARTLARFEGHQGIVSVRDVFRENGTAYFVMFYMEGMTLKEYLKQQGGKVPYDTAFQIMMPVMDALREVHAQGLLHRDVTPDNIYITNTGQVKILDFGAARYSMGEHSKSLSVILKPGFAPEEQYRQKGNQGPWTDVYAIAGTFYRAITGKVPPEALDRLDTDELKPPSALGVDISPDAEAALLVALAVRAPERFQSIEAFQQALLSGPEIVDPVAVGEEPPPPPGFEVGPTKRLDDNRQESWPSVVHADEELEEPRRTPVALIVTLSLLLFVVLGGGIVALVYFAPWDNGPGPEPGPGPGPDSGTETHALTLTLWPSDARVEIVDPAVDFENGMQLEPGTYLVRVSSPNFVTQERTVVIADQDVTETFSLAEAGDPDASYPVYVKALPEGVIVEIVQPDMDFSQGMSLNPGSYLFRFTYGDQVVEEWIEVSDSKVAIMAYMDGTQSGDTHAGDGPGPDPDADVAAGRWMEPFAHIPMVWVEGDCFTMGSPDRELLRYADESPQHEVCLDGFWMGQFEVTQAQFRQVMGYNDSTFGPDDSLPVETVTWEEAQAFMRRLNEANGDQYNFRLPTEAEWEFACRAGSNSPFSFGETIDTSWANYDGTSAYGSGQIGQYREKTTAVGSFDPNNFGLYDMHGNVYEWVQDVFVDNAYNDHAYFNPVIMDQSLGQERVIRGGSWFTYGEYCRCAFRNYFAQGAANDQVGFRVVRER